MSTIDTRREQMFPKLEPREIDRLRRFGDVRRYSAGEAPEPAEPNSAATEDSATDPKWFSPQTDRLC